jgi:hypothetical protein
MNQIWFGILIGIVGTVVGLLIWANFRKDDTPLMRDELISFWKESLRQKEEELNILNEIWKTLEKRG